MAAQTELENLELYLAWKEDRRSSNPRSIQDWIARHPEAKDQLLEWMTDEPRDRVISRLAVDEAAEARIERTGLDMLRELRAAYVAEPVAPPIQSLSKEAGQRGMKLAQLAEAIGLGDLTMMKLERRLITAATLPQSLISQLAKALETTEHALRTYFSRPPALSGAMYHSDQAPKVSKTESFEKAVSADSGMTPESKQTWLES